MSTPQPAENLKTIHTHVSGVLRALGESPSEISASDDPDTRALKTALRERQLKDREEFIKVYQPAIMAYIQGVLSKFIPGDRNMPDHVSTVWSNLVDRFLQGKLRSFKHTGEEGSFRAWIRRVISNDCKRYLKKMKDTIGGKQIISLPEDFDPEYFDSEDQTLEEVLRETVIERAYEAMEDDGLYGVAVLFAAERDGKFTTEELAEHLTEKSGKTVSKDAAKKRLERGRQLFAQTLIEQVAKLDDSNDLERIEETLIELKLLGNCKRALGDLRS